MSGVNKVILVGRLGADPDTRTTSMGQTVCTLSLATSDSWIKDGKREEKTEWHRVILWARQAEVASKYLKKGRMVYIEGRIQTRSWEDKQGQKRYTTEIIASNMQFIESQNSSNLGHSMADMPDSIPLPEGSENEGGYTNRTQMNYSAAQSGMNSVHSRSLDDDIPF